MAYGRYQSCISVCYECATACEHGAAACLHEHDVKMMARCMEFGPRLGRYLPLGPRADVEGFRGGRQIRPRALCRGLPSLAEECRKHKMDHRQECANACERCADECEKMAGVHA